MKMIFKVRIKEEEKEIVYLKKFLLRGKLIGDIDVIAPILDRTRGKETIVMGGTYYIKSNINNPLSIVGTFREVYGKDLLDIDVVEGRLKTIPYKKGRIY